MGINVVSMATPTGGVIPKSHFGQGQGREVTHLTSNYMYIKGVDQTEETRKCQCAFERADRGVVERHGQ